RSGAAGIDLCSLAAGRVDGYYERGLNAWDVAAGDLIAREAGAVTGGRPGERLSRDLTVAATPGVFEPLQRLLEDFGAWHD
ncbi:inositol monophosphatase family protein, partial [Streptomyces sp. NPDC059374]|uniref:inositol monophosphatase family protein n=1 Tax=Streptomyces sp. NPDC059374 TaxID=3346814 RepID=UPI0036892CBB